MVTRFLLSLSFWLAIAGLVQGQPRPASSKPPLSAPQPKAPQKVVPPLKLALLVQIKEYPTEKGKVGYRNLSNGNGLVLLKTTLAHQGFQIPDTLVDKQATANNIRQALESLIDRLKKLGNAAKGAIVLCSLDGHGQEIPDQEDGDEAKKKNTDPRLEKDVDDEAFVAYDSPYKDNVEWANLRKKPTQLAVEAKKYLIDDELAGFYNRIREAIGPQGHLIVLQPGCHSYSGMRGPEGQQKKWVLDEQSLRGQGLGKLYFFSSVQNDSHTVLHDEVKKVSLLVWGFCNAVASLKPKTSTYCDLYETIKTITQPLRTVSNPFYLPGLSKDSPSGERVFRGFVVPTTSKKTQVVSLEDQLKSKLPDWMRGLLESWTKTGTAKGGSERSSSNSKGGTRAVSDTLKMVFINEGLESGNQPGQLVEFADQQGNSVAQGMVVAADADHALVRLDSLVNNLGRLRVRSAVPNLRLYLDEALSPALWDSVAQWGVLTDTPEAAQLVLTQHGDSIRICAQDLPFSQNACRTLSADNDTVLRKIRGLVLYHWLRNKEYRDSSITIVHQQSKWVEGWTYSPTDSARTRQRLASCNEQTNRDLRRIDSLAPIALSFKARGYDVVDTQQSSLQIEVRRPNNDKLYFQRYDVYPDQYVTEPGGKPESGLGRELYGDDTEKIWARGNDTLRAKIPCFGHPFGLEENVFLFSQEPINIKGLLDGKVPLSWERVSPIVWTQFSYYWILPDRKPYEVKK